MMRPLDQAVALNILLNLNYMHVLQRQEALAAQQQRIAQVKPTSQLNLMPAAAAGFWPDCYFSRSVGRRPIFLTLNKVVNSPSGHLTIAAGRLFGRRPILSSNYQIFGRCPGGDRPDSWRSPPGVLSIAAGRQWIPQSPAVHLQVTGRSPAGVLPVCV